MLFYLPSYWVLGVDYDPLEGQRIGLELKGVGPIIVLEQSSGWWLERL